MTPTQPTTFKTEEPIKKRFFATNADDETFPIQYGKNVVTITTRWGDKVAFTRTRNGKRQSFRDSREPKKTVDADYVMAELVRMLDTKEQAEAAFAALSA